MPHPYSLRFCLVCGAPTPRMHGSYHRRATCSDECLYQLRKSRMHGQQGTDAREKSRVVWGLPPMTRKERLIYNNLRRHGASREDTLRVIFTRASPQGH